jgi:hypothetical protein
MEEGMASFSRGDGVVGVKGSISTDDLEAFIEHGNWLLGAESKVVTLDLSAMNPDESSFVGAVAQLGTEAHRRSKTLVVKATGRAADMLSWAGLHRVVTLHISSVPAPAGV